MLLKDKILGIRCELLESQQEAFQDEFVVLIGRRELCLRQRSIGFLQPLIKLAVLGESPFYVKAGSIMQITGPTRTRRYLVKINSRGYVEKFFVEEKNIIFLDS